MLSKSSISTMWNAYHVTLIALRPSLWGWTGIQPRIESVESSLTILDSNPIYKDSTLPHRDWSCQTVRTLLPAARQAVSVYWDSPQWLTRIITCFFFRGIFYLNSGYCMNVGQPYKYEWICSKDIKFSTEVKHFLLFMYKDYLTKQPQQISDKRFGEPLSPTSCLECCCIWRIDSTEVLK